MDDDERAVNNAQATHQPHISSRESGSCLIAVAAIRPECVLAREEKEEKTGGSVVRLVGRMTRRSGTAAPKRLAIDAKTSAAFGQSTCRSRTLTRKIEQARRRDSNI